MSTNLANTKKIVVARNIYDAIKEDKFLGVKTTLIETGGVCWDSLEISPDDDFPNDTWAGFDSENALVFASSNLHLALPMKYVFCHQKIIHDIQERGLALEIEGFVPIKVQRMPEEVD